MPPQLLGYPVEILHEALWGVSETQSPSVGKLGEPPKCRLQSTTAWERSASAPAPSFTHGVVFVSVQRSGVWLCLVPFLP